MRDLLERFRETKSACTCEASVRDGRLVVEADDCPGGGDLSAAPACRATVISALRERDVTVVLTRSLGTERRYEGVAAALLTAAGRFSDVAEDYDSELAEQATRDPLLVGRLAAGRAGPVADAAAATGLAEVAEATPDYDALRAVVGLTVARSRLHQSPPPDARLRETRELDSGATVRIYTLPADELRTYHLEPVETAFDRAERQALACANERLAAGHAGSGDRAPERAVQHVTDERVSTLAAVLRKHTRGYGVLEDLFADPAVTDVFATAPVSENDLWVRTGGESMRTNVRLTEAGAATLASRLRRASGHAFSRSNPTLDAVATDVGNTDRVRAAGITSPVSPGTGFAFRAHSGSAFTLARLVAAGALPARAAALLSLATERGAATLVAGSRGAGKTTLLGALLWELPAATRTVVIEDTPELPVSALQGAGRDVQPLRTDLDGSRGLAPADALRTALRLGEGALVVGEVRGGEARVLYEAMRVGANQSAVLGTIHGDGGAAVRERVVSDLGVPASSFAATDLLVTVESQATSSGTRRRLAAVEEVLDGGDGVSFAPLFERADEGCRPTGRIDRGNSRAVAALARPGERYNGVLDRLSARESFLVSLVERERTDAAAVVSAHGDRRRQR